MNLEEEKQIIEKVREDKQSFGLIYKAYLSDIYRYSYAVVYDKSKAEDIVQETFTRALEKIDNFEWRGISVKYWLLAIARNVIYESYEKEAVLPGDEMFEKIPDPSAGSGEIDIGLQKDIAEVLGQLPVTTREIIILKIWEEYTFSQIARMVNKTEGAVKMQFYRGIEELRRILESKGYDERFAAYPFIFAGILKAGESEMVQPSTILLNYKSIKMEQTTKTPNGVHSSGSATVAKGLAAKYVAAGILGVAVLGAGGYLGYKYLSDSERSNDDNNEVETTISDEGGGVEENQLPVGWTMVTSDVCKVSLPLPPKDPPYYKEENGIAWYWMFGEDDGTAAYGLDMDGSAFVRFYNDQDLGSGYVASLADVDCAKNSEDYDTREFADYVSRLIEGDHEGLGGVTTCSPTQEVVEMWGVSVVKLVFNCTMPNGNPMISSGEMGPDTYYVYANSEQLYLVSTINDNKESLFQETTEIIFKNLEFIEGSSTGGGH